MALNLYEIGPDETRGSSDSPAVELPYDSDRVYTLVGTRGDWLTTLVPVTLLLLIAAGFGYTVGAFW